MLDLGHYCHVMEVVMLYSVFSSLIAHILRFQALFYLRNVYPNQHFLLILPVPVLGKP